MPTTRRFLVAAALLLGIFGPVFAQGPAGELRLPHIFGDNMVLQAGAATPVWGWAAPGQEVTVEAAGRTATATAGADGRWAATLKDLAPGDQPVTLTVSAGAKITIANVLIGDVWLGSGQSNMDFPVAAAANAPAEIAEASHKLIRLFIVPMLGRDQPRDDCGGAWVVCSPETVGGFSAVLYFFGREIHAQTGRPLGLIRSSVGGTPIESWTPMSAFPEFPDPAGIADRVRAAEAAYRAALPGRLQEVEAWTREAVRAIAEGRPVPQTPVWPEPAGDGPTSLYNAMIHPLIPFGIRGVIWYQGESNGGEGDTYLKKMQALVGSWRNLWGRGDFPFYFVQIANWGPEDDSPEGGNGWARCREAQLRSLAIANTGMAVTVDIGEAGDIHPKNKQDVGKRLARWALNREYGKADLEPSGPLYEGMTVENRSIRVRFTHVGGGLMAGRKTGLEPVQPVPGNTLCRFAIAGADRKWRWADARIDGDAIVVSSPDVPSPVAVRYAFSMNPEHCNLYNKDGLPASPFRTDDW